MTKILVEKQRYRYKAWFENCEGKNALGKTFHEAIGSLVYTFPEDVMCEIKEVDA